MLHPLHWPSWVSHLQQIAVSPAGHDTSSHSKTFRHLNPFSFYSSWFLTGLPGAHVELKRRFAVDMSKQIDPILKNSAGWTSRILDIQAVCFPFPSKRQQVNRLFLHKFTIRFTTKCHRCWNCYQRKAITNEYGICSLEMHEIGKKHLQYLDFLLFVLQSFHHITSIALCGKEL